jgi:hypothetical protein
MRNPPLLAAAFSAALLTTPMLAHAQQQLTVVDVNAPAVNCVFSPDCRIVVNDSIGAIPLPFITTPGTAWLQSRTFTAAPGTPAAGKTGYIYRVSLTEAAGSAECLGGLVLNFGAVPKLPYAPGVMADVFVITTGGLGTIKLSGAAKTGDVIEFSFSTGLCLNGPANIANTTFFFGLASDATPMNTTAGIWASGSTPYYSVNARVPTH